MSDNPTKIVEINLVVAIAIAAMMLSATVANTVASWQLTKLQSKADSIFCVQAD